MMQAQVHDAIVESEERLTEATGLENAKQVGIEKGGRKTIRKVLAAISGTLGIPAGALTIVVAALGLAGGAIPIAGWSITAVIGLIALGTISWAVVNKIRTNLKA